jgi:hypothetical protein
VTVVLRSIGSAYDDVLALEEKLFDDAGIVTCALGNAFESSCRVAVVLSSPTSELTRRRKSE